MVITLRLDVVDGLTEQETNQLVVDAAKRLEADDGPKYIDRIHYSVDKNGHPDDIYGI